jgi:Tol biopolymer transport system component
MRNSSPGVVWSVVASMIGLPALAGETLPKSDAMLKELKGYTHRIVFETWRDTSHELFIMNADGSNPVNLTNTPDVNELYPKASPDGTMIAFVADEGKGKDRARNIYLMNVDGTGRRKIADNANQPCWNADSTVIAYIPNRPGPYTIDQGANKGLMFYEVATGRRWEHVNKGIERMLCISWSPDGKWFACSAIGGLGYAHSIIAFEANGTGHRSLVDAADKLWQCRPDVSPDGRQIAFAKAVGEGPGDGPDKVLGIEVCDLDLSGPLPKLTHPHWVATGLDPIEVYHADWSPDGRYIACSWGPKEKNKMKTARYVVGVKATDWNICVIDPRGMNVWTAITTDGQSNKEPEWVRTPATPRK